MRILNIDMVTSLLTFDDVIIRLTQYCLITLDRRYTDDYNYTRWPS